MTTSEQLPLGLPHRVALGGDDFFVAPSNQAAVDWIDRWPDWPGGVLILTGLAGAGKSHLAAVWQHAANARGLAASDLAASDILAARRGECLLIEEADHALSSANETDLFHLVNTVREVGGSLLLTARDGPGQWPICLPDLASRLKAAPITAIGKPDEALMAAVLLKQFADRQLRVGPDVAAYLVPRLERSFNAVRQAVERLDVAALAEQRAITVPFARRILDL